jgi:hypothetical protein
VIVIVLDTAGTVNGVELVEGLPGPLKVSVAGVPTANPPPAPKPKPERPLVIPVKKGACFTKKSLYMEKDAV